MKNIHEKETPTELTAVEWLYLQSANKKLDLFDLLEAKAMEKKQREEEVLETIRKYALEEHLITSSKPDMWFEQFKKK